MQDNTVKPRFAGTVRPFASGLASSLLLILAAYTVLAAPPPQRTGSGAAVSTGTVDDAVRDGTRFLVRLDDRLRTGHDRLNKKFKVRTLEPLETVAGLVVPPNAEIRGHITRIEPAGLTGRARMWLTFDDIKTRNGRMPIIAEVAEIGR